MIDILFMIFAAVAIGSALGVVLSRNPVGSLLFMVASLASIAGLFVLMEAHFLAAIQVMVVDNFPIVTGASTLAPSEDRTLCGGLVVDMAVVVVEEGSLGLTVAIANTSVNDWFGTVQLSVGGTRIPVDLGKVEAGQEAERTIPLRVPEGTVEFDGSLLIGP